MLRAEACTALGRLDGAGRLPATPDLLLRPLQRREALKSSSLEGTYASTEELLLFELDPPLGSLPPSEVLEVHNYSAALRLGVELLETTPFCLRLIKDMHRRLLMGVRGKNKQPGVFRSTQVHIGSDRRFVPPPPSRLDECLRQLETAIHERPRDIHQLLWCFMVHYQFETIHPFNDGNGRIGRLLLALMISTEFNMICPWLYMSPYFDRHKDEYIDSLFRVSAEGDWKGWLEFCLRGAIAQANDAMKRLEALIMLQDSFRERIAASNGSARLFKILDGLFLKAPITTVTNLSSYLGVSYPTALSDLERLRNMGVVSLLESHKPKTYLSWEIVRIGTDQDEG
jgi:Fic family protein